MNAPTIWGGVIALLLAYIGYLQAGRVAERNARGQLEVKRLENAHAAGVLLHGDTAAVTARWMECVEARARCEAGWAALARENAELLAENTALEARLARLDAELRELQQKMVFVDFIQGGRLSGEQIMEFGKRLLQGRED